MVTCPRCQQPVDETVRANCPLCFTPIPQPNANAVAPHMGVSLVGTPPEPQFPQAGGPLDPVPQPAPPPTGYGQPEASPPPMQGYHLPPMQQGYQQPTMPGPGPVPPAPRPMNPGARVSLTGEVIDSSMPQGPPPSYVGGSGATAPPRGPQPGGPSRPTTTMRRPEAAVPERSGGNPAIGIVVALVLVLGGGFGGWYYWMHRTNPKDQALLVYKAYLSQDYKTAYALTALSPEDAKKFPNAESFASEREKAVDKLLGSNPAFANLKSAIQESAKSAAASASVGEPVVNGDKADVPTSCQMTIMGQSFGMKGTAHLINESGVWKLDLTTPASALQNQIDLQGKPDMSGMPGMRR